MPAFSWSFTLGLALALVWTVIPQISAQSLSSGTPSPVQECAFARSGSKLLVSGGRATVNNNQQNLTGQLFALDLSRSWDVSNPAWTQLAASDPNYWYYMVAAPDNNTVYTLKTGINNSMIVNTYDVQANAWLPSTMTLPATTETRQGVHPILDPTSWLIYLDASSYLDIFNPNNTGVTNVSNMPPNTFTSRMFAGGAYNKARHSLMYYGGLNYSIQFDLQATYVTEYTISTNTWSNLTTTGTPPPVRSDFCMAASEDGNTVVVYGGRSPNSPTTPTNFTNTLFILNVPTGQWTQGPNGDLRAYMACIIVGDQLIAWGGTDGVNTLNVTPKIFDLTKLVWVTSYTAPQYYLNAPKSTSAAATPGSTSTTVPLPGSSGGSTSKSSNMGAILGGSLGGLAVIGLAGAIFWYLKRKEKALYSAPADQQGSGNEASRNGLMSASGAEKDGRQTAIATAGMVYSNEVRNPQNSTPISTNPNSRGPQDQSGFGTMAPLMGGGEGYTAVATGYSPYNQNQHMQQQYQAYPPPPVQYAFLPKEMHADSASVVHASQFSVAPTNDYVPKTAYAAPAGVGMPPISAASVPYQLTTNQGYLSSGALTEDIYKAHNIGSPDVSTFADSTAASTPYTRPPTFTSQPAGSPIAVPGYVPTSSYTRGTSNQTFSTTAANSSPAASHASYNYNSNSSFSPSTVAHSGDLYAPSSVAAASPAMSAAGHAPLPLNQSSFTEKGVASTAAVRVPDSVPEDQYLSYVLAQQQHMQQHDQSLTSTATTTGAYSTPLSVPTLQNLPPRPNMQARFSSTGPGSANVVHAAPGFEDIPINTQDVNYANFARLPPGSNGSNSSGYVRPPLAPPQ